MLYRYECTLCGDKFWFTQDLKEHLTNVHARKTEEVEDSEPMVEPVIEEFKTEDEDFKVEDFTETESVDSEDMEDIKTDGDEDFSVETESVVTVGSFKCTSCPKAFTRNDSLRVHIRFAHFGIKYECPDDECSKSFPYTSLLKTHLKKKHGVTNANVLKEIVQNIYQKTNEDHGLMHHKCTHCSKTFKYALSCKTHIQRVHLGIKHECPEDECSKSFQNTKNLKVHLKSQHKVTDPNVLKIIAKKSIRETNKKMKERNIATEDLKSEAKDSKVIDKSMLETKKELQSDQTEAKSEPMKNFPCQKCPKVCLNVHQLEKHTINIHPGFKPHQCTYCPKEYAKIKNFNAHIKAAHLGIRHQCPISYCPKMFKLRSSIKSHLKSKHKKTDPKVIEELSKKSIQVTNKKMKERKITTEDLKSEAKDSKVTKKNIRKTTEKMEEINLVNEDSKSGEVKISNSENIDQVGIDEPIIMNDEPMLDDKTELMVMNNEVNTDVKETGTLDKVVKESTEKLNEAKNSSDAKKMFEPEDEFETDDDELKKKEALFKCDSCAIYFYNSKALTEHLNSRHGKNQIKFKCGKCSEVFDLQDELSVHASTKHHNTPCKDPIMECLGPILRSLQPVPPTPDVKTSTNQPSIDINNRVIMKSSGKQTLVSRPLPPLLPMPEVKKSPPIVKIKKPKPSSKSSVVLPMPAAKISTMKKRTTSISPPVQIPSSTSLLEEYRGPDDKCKNCGKQFLHDMSLLRHIKEKHLGIMHKCRFCEREFTQKTRLSIHTRAIHYGVKHECPFAECSSAHEASAELKKHLAKRHDMVDPDLSEVVKKSIASVHERYDAMKMQEPENSSAKAKTSEDEPMLDSNSGGIIIDDQPLQEDKPEMMIIEDEPIHNTNIISPSEAIIDETKNDQNVNEESEISILETSTRKVTNHIDPKSANQRFDKTITKIKYICPYPGCHGTLDVGAEFKQHLEQEHNLVDPELTQKFHEIVSNITKMSKPITKSAKKDLARQCSICFQHFSTLASIRNHITEVHYGVKYVCTYCDQPFWQNSRLRSHIRSEHFAGNAKLFQEVTQQSEIKLSSVEFKCSTCSLLFRNKKSVLDHIKNVHQEVVVIDEPKKIIANPKMTPKNVMMNSQSPFFDVKNPTAKTVNLQGEKSVNSKVTPNVMKILSKKIVNLPGDKPQIEDSMQKRKKIVNLQCQKSVISKVTPNVVKNLPQKIVDLPSDKPQIGDSMQTCIKGAPNNEKIISQKVIVIQENPINDVIIVPGIQKETVKVCPTITLGTFEKMKTPKRHRRIASPILQDKTNAENSYLKIVSPATTNQAVQNPGNKAKQLKVNLEDPTKLIKFTWTGSNWGVLPEN